MVEVDNEAGFAIDVDKCDIHLLNSVGSLRTPYIGFEFMKSAEATEVLEESGEGVATSKAIGPGVFVGIGDAIFIVFGAVFFVT